MLHMPVLRAVTVLPLTVQTEGVVEAYATGRFDVAVPDNIAVPPTTTWDDGAENEIVWG